MEIGLGRLYLWVLISEMYFNCMCHTSPLTDVYASYEMLKQWFFSLSFYILLWRFILTELYTFCIGGYVCVSQLDADPRRSPLRPNKLIMNVSTSKVLTQAQCSASWYCWFLYLCKALSWYCYRWCWVKWPSQKFHSSLLPLLFLCSSNGSPLFYHARSSQSA